LARGKELTPATQHEAFFQILLHGLFWSDYHNNILWTADCARPRPLGDTATATASGAVGADGTAAAAAGTTAAAATEPLLRLRGQLLRLTEPLLGYGDETTAARIAVVGTTA
jgi:hypothetical protein